MSERTAIAPARQGSSTGAVAGAGAIVGGLLGLTPEMLAAFIALWTGVLAAIGNVSRDRVHRAEAAGNEPAFAWEIGSFL